MLIILKKKLRLKNFVVVSHSLKLRKFRAEENWPNREDDRSNILNNKEAWR